MIQTKNGKICVAVVIAMALFFIGWVLVRPTTIKKNCFKESDNQGLYNQFSENMYEKCLKRNGL
jgi:hypothetical protein